MDRETIMEHLAQAERHIAEGERHIAEQRERVARLSGGHDRLLAAELLEQFERTQVLHIADRDRLRRELEELDSA